jgi:hypothetical protein
LGLHVWEEQQQQWWQHRPRNMLFCKRQNMLFACKRPA